MSVLVVYLAKCSLWEVFPQTKSLRLCYLISPLVRILGQAEKGIKRVSESEFCTTACN